MINPDPLSAAHILVACYLQLTADHHLAGSRVFSGVAGSVSIIVDWVMNNLNLTFSLLQQTSSEASTDKLNYWIICRYKIMIKLPTQCTPLLFTRWWGWSSSLSSCFSSFLIRTVRRSPVSSCLWLGQSQPTGDVEVLIQIKLYEIVPKCPLKKILIGFSLLIYCNFYQPKSLS